MPIPMRTFSVVILFYVISTLEVSLARRRTRERSYGPLTQVSLSSYDFMGN